jgi:hypothetical protein
MSRSSVSSASSVVAVLAILAAASAEDKKLSRTEDLVVLTGADLRQLKGIHQDLVRLYASHQGKLEPIAFQVDKKTPELEYCWTTGPEPVKDVHEGKLDEDDEVVFRARDAGEKTKDTIPGATLRLEVELEDPLDGGRAFAYILAFAEKAPEKTASRFVEVLPAHEGGAVFRTDAFEIAATGSSGLTGRPVNVRFRQPDGSFGPVVVRDAARLSLHARYLLARIDRGPTETRSSLGSTYLEGPVRALAPVTLEVYLISGHWITSSRAFIAVHDHTFELRAHFAVPVDLDPDPKRASEARIAIEPAAAASSWQASGGEGLAAIFGPEGGVATRLELDRRLSLKASAPPEIALDLTGLHKSEDTTPYDMTAVVLVLPSARREDLDRLILARDKPLKRAVR